VKLFDKYSLYWKSMLPFCVELVAVIPSWYTLVHPVDNNWLREAELNGQACAIDPMRLIVAWRRSGFSMKIPSIMATCSC